MKKRINDPRDVVREMLAGLELVSPGLALLEGGRVVLGADLPAYTGSRPVAVTSEAGAGQTDDMFPRMGRASHLGKRATVSPDGGAVAVTGWISAIDVALT